jgi:hypothetical protein
MAMMGSLEAEGIAKAEKGVAGVAEGVAEGADGGGPNKDMKGFALQVINVMMQ